MIITKKAMSRRTVLKSAHAVLAQGGDLILHQRDQR